MADRIVAVAALAGALLIALAVAGVFSAPPTPALGAPAEYCQYGQDQYGNCLPPPTDSTPPTIGAVQSPPQNAFGWNNTNVTVTVTATDEPGGSGVASITCQLPGVPPTTTTGATRNLTITTASTAQFGLMCTAADNAGNVSSPVTRQVRIDKVPPLISFASAAPPQNGFGWNNTNVTLSWNCSDAASGVLVSTVGRTLTTDGLDQSASATCTDRAGNTASGTHGGVNIDKTPPLISFVGQTPPPNTAGWNNTPVALDWNCLDALSGVFPALSMTTLFINGEGAGQQATATCADYAGNFSGDTHGGVNIDETAPAPPTASADRAPDFADGGGWYRDVVTVSFAANGDPPGRNGTTGSGVDPATTSAPVTFDTNGSHDASGTVSDRAGNVSDSGTLTVRVDADDPVLSATFTTADGAPYLPGTWTNQAVTATFSCADDGGSGVASTSPPQTVSTQGTDQRVTGACTDNVGHTTMQTFAGIDIDLTPPEAVVGFDPVSGDVVVTFTDTGGSGVPGGPVTGVPTGGKGPAKGDRRYTQSDGAGNTLTVVLRVKSAPHDFDASFETLSYNGGPESAAPDNDLRFSFDTAKDGSVKRLSQDVRVGKGPAAVHVTADYDPKKDQTKIHAGRPGPDGDTTRPGLVLVTVATSTGSLVVEY